MAGEYSIGDLFGQIEGMERILKEQRAAVRETEKAIADVRREIKQKIAALNVPVCHVCREKAEGLVNCGWCGKPTCPSCREADEYVSPRQGNPYCDTCIEADGNY